MRTKTCTIVGSKEHGSKWTAQVAEDAYLIGSLAVKHGFSVITGGLSGVMEYAAKGAKASAGLTIGILPGEGIESANSYIDVVIPSGIGLARNSITALAGDIMIALPGGLGTLQEITYALEYDRPVCSYGSFELAHQSLMFCEAIEKVDTWLFLQAKILMTKEDKR